MTLLARVVFALLVAATFSAFFVAQRLKSAPEVVNTVKVPKFFLQMQISRIQTAQGNPPAAAGQQVDHLRDKVTKNAAGESKALLDQVVALATQLK